MKTHNVKLLFAALVMALLIGNNASGVSGMCLIDDKPTLDLQPVRQSELVHFIAVQSGMQSQEGLSPQQQYDNEVQGLIEAGYPSILAGQDSDQIVDRRYFNTMLFQLALSTNQEFAEKYGQVSDEDKQLKALEKEGWISNASESGGIFRQEVVASICSQDITTVWAAGGSGGDAAKRAKEKQQLQSGSGGGGGSLPQDSEGVEFIMSNIDVP